MVITTGGSWKKRAVANRNLVCGKARNRHPMDIPSSALVWPRTIEGAQLEQAVSAVLDGWWRRGAAGLPPEPSTPGSEGGRVMRSGNAPSATERHARGNATPAATPTAS